MWTKNNHFICDECGKFAKPYDSYTPYGCSNYDPPEPHDPIECCKKCSQKWYKEWCKSFQSNKLCYGDWHKSKAEIRAAKKYKLIWIHDRGFPQTVEVMKRKYYQYVTQQEYDKFQDINNQTLY